MTIYLDLLFILNFSFDFILLLSVNIVLKRMVKIRRIIVGSLIGALSIFFLFLPLNSITLFILKFVISLLMILVTFKYKDLKYTINNILYLYVISILLGGALYYLNVEFSYKQVGIIFINKGMSINYIILLILSPLVIYTYIRQIKSLKNNYIYYYVIKIVFKNNMELILNAFLDSGNKLKDPITNKSIILVPKSLVEEVIRIRSPIYVPYTSLNNHGLLKCIAPKYIEIDNKRCFKLLVGLSEDKFSMDGVECIINTDIMEGLI